MLVVLRAITNGIADTYIANKNKNLTGTVNLLKSNTVLKKLCIQVFEIVGAFGTGYSLGWPNTTTSLSAQFRVASKLFVMAVMIIGRNRVLVDSVDRAVQIDWADMEEKPMVSLTLQNFD